MSDLSESASEERGSPAFIEIHDTNAQFPSPIQETKDTDLDTGSDISRSILADPLIVPEFDAKTNSLEDCAVQTDLSFPSNLPNDVQNVLNAYTVMAELSDLESLSIDDIIVVDSSESENLQQHPQFNYDIPSPPLTDEDMLMLYESLSSSERLDGDLFQSALHDCRILSPPLSDIDGQLVLPEDAEMEVMADNEKTEDPENSQH